MNRDAAVVLLDWSTVGLYDVTDEHITVLRTDAVG